MVVASPQAAASKNSGGERQDQRLAERNNGQRRLRGRQVPSRYMSPSPSTSSSSLSSSSNTTSTSSSSTTTLTAAKRFSSPLISRPANSASNLTTPGARTPSVLPKRSQSANPRRPVSRPAAPVEVANTAELSAATKMLITSTRSLSVSFQGETFSLPVSKKKETTTPVSHRKATPERRRSTPVRDRGENSRPVDQHRWPGTARKAITGSDPNQLSRSLDYGGDNRKLVGFGSGILGQSLLRQSIIDDGRRSSVDGRPSLDLCNAEEFLLMRDESKRNPATNSTNELASSVSCDPTASDTDSVSSGSTNGVHEYGGVNGEVSRGKSLPRSIMASARFWQETNSRLRRLQDPGSPLSTSPSARISLSSKFIQSKRFSSDGHLSSPRTVASPVRGATRPASPSKLWASSSPSRGNFSPARARNSVAEQMSSYARETPSILSFSADIRRGKIAEDRVIDAHALRLLYNRYLQWRFVNARADATFMVQILSAERSLWSAWVSMSELRHSVTLRRIKLLLLRQKLKLASVLKGQMVFLEEWALLDAYHSSSLSGATEALKASTLRLPVVGKAVADIYNLKEAVGSAVDVMQAMASTMCSLSPKVEEVNSVMAELVNMTVKEKAMLDRCKDLLSTVAAMQVTDCSFKTHITQLSRLPITGSLTTRV